jgi:ABC-2 type transport system permease protein
VVLLELGALPGLSQRVVGASPFAYVPKLPDSAFMVTPLLRPVGISAALGAVGVAGFRRRDIG